MGNNPIFGFYDALSARTFKLLFLFVLKLLYGLHATQLLQFSIEYRLSYGAARKRRGIQCECGLLQAAQTDASYCMNSRQHGRAYGNSCRLVCPRKRCHRRRIRPALLAEVT